MLQLKDNLNDKKSEEFQVKKQNEERLRIYFLPNLMTAGNLLCGFFALWYIVKVTPPVGTDIPFNAETIIPALWLILGAFMFDALDGRIARLIGKESSFGLQFDSLADIISFGAAPAFLMQRVILHEFQELGLVVASVYLLCGALRLARYNCLAVLPNTSNNKEFLGFPIPASAALVASLTIFFIWLEGKEMTNTMWRWVLLSVLVFLSVMMVSEVKYPTFKTLDFRTRRPFTKFVVCVTGVACLVVLWEYIIPVILPIIFTSYLIYGFIRPKLSRKLRKEIEEEEVEDD